MANDALTTYLNDHLAGAGAALELLDHLVATPDPPGGSAFLTALRAEIAEDRDVLEDVVHRVAGGPPSTLRQLGGWVAEKAGRLKLIVDDPPGLKHLESLEVLVLGIHGKQALWRALAAVAPMLPALAGLDFPRLLSRAEDQHGRVEARRVESARAALLDRA